MGKFSQILYAVAYVGLLAAIMYLFGVEGFIAMVVMGTFIFPMSQVKWFLIGVLLGSLFGGWDFENPVQGFVFGASESPLLYGVFGAILAVAGIFLASLAYSDFKKSGFKGLGDEAWVAAVLAVILGVIAIGLSLTDFVVW